MSLPIDSKIDLPTNTNALPKQAIDAPEGPAQLDAPTAPPTTEENSEENDKNKKLDIENKQLEQNGLKRQLTRPTPMVPTRSATQRSTASLLGFVKLSRKSSSAPNGTTLSQLRQIFWQAVQDYAPTRSALGSRILGSNTNLPLFVFDALAFAIPSKATIADFTPDIEVKSKKKKNSYKQIRAIIDTGCHSGNWVTNDFISKLGIKGELLPLTANEERGSQGATGKAFYARGAVNLTWRGIPGKGLPNCGRTFKKMRFLVSNVEDPPYDILIGLHSICEHKILFTPTLVHNIPTLPRKSTKSQAKDPYNSIQARRERSKKLLEESAAALDPAPDVTINAGSHRQQQQQPQPGQHPPTPVESRAASFSSTNSKHSGGKSKIIMITRTNSNKPPAVK